MRSFCQCGIVAAEEVTMNMNVERFVIGVNVLGDAVFLLGEEGPHATQTLVDALEKAAGKYADEQKRERALKAAHCLLYDQLGWYKSWHRNPNNLYKWSSYHTQQEALKLLRDALAVKPR